MNGPVLAQLSESEYVSDQLCHAGLSEESAAEKSRLFATSAAALADQGVRRDAHVVAYFVPGRIEVLGKHTDYAGGRSLLAAVERGFCAIAARRTDSNISVCDAITGRQASFPFEAKLALKQGHWSNYPMTVAKRVASNFPGSFQGAQIAWASDLPIASGMSSSSALVVSVFLLLSAINELPARDDYRQHIQSTEDLASYLGATENGRTFGDLASERGVGTFGGSEDHTAVLCSKSGQLEQFSYCPVQWERSVQLPTDFVFAIGSSGVIAEKTGAALEKYNRVSMLASSLVEVWNQFTDRNDPHLAAAVSSSADAADRLREELQRQCHGVFTSEQLLDRLEQFVTENQQIIPQVPEKLTSENLTHFGELVERSQSIGSRLLANQVPETIFLAESARQRGAAAASAFGAGFGGSVWALVRRDDADGFIDRWRRDYIDAFPEVAAHAAFFTSNAGPAACPIGEGASIA